MSNDPPIVYVESSVFLALLKGETGRVEDCRSVMIRAESGEIALITSAVTLTEIIRVNDSLLPEDVEETIERFFQHRWIHLVQVDRPVATRARRISREFNLKPLDAIHVASAMSRGAKLLLTYDKHILKIRTVGQMEIQEPSGQRALDLDTPE